MGEKAKEEKPTMQFIVGVSFNKEGKSNSLIADAIRLEIKNLTKKKLPFLVIVDALIMDEFNDYEAESFVRIGPANPMTDRPVIGLAREFSQIRELAKYKANVIVLSEVFFAFRIRRDIQQCLKLRGMSEATISFSSLWDKTEEFFCLESAKIWRKWAWLNRVRENFLISLPFWLYEFLAGRV